MITLFHGSPHNVAVLKPSVPRGDTKFQTTKAVFFTQNEKMAQLYAIARDKKRMRKNWFMIGSELHMVEQPVNKQGYVYVTTQPINKVTIGRGIDSGQFAITKNIQVKYKYIIKEVDVRRNIHFHKDKKSLHKTWIKLNNHM